MVPMVLGGLALLDWLQATWWTACAACSAVHPRRRRAADAAPAPPDQTLAPVEGRPLGWRRRAVRRAVQHGRPADRVPPLPGAVGYRHPRDPAGVLRGRHPGAHRRDRRGRRNRRRGPDLDRGGLPAVLAGTWAGRRFPPHLPDLAMRRIAFVLLAGLGWRCCSASPDSLARGRGSGGPAVARADSSLPAAARRRTGTRARAHRRLHRAGIRGPLWQQGGDRGG